MARSPRKNPKKSSGSDHHHVYVVFLQNPSWKERSGWYVGMTGLTPEQRFENHKNGIRAARVVRKYGVRLVPRLYAHLNPMSYEKALAMEKWLFESLRKRGYKNLHGGH